MPAGSTLSPATVTPSSRSALAAGALVLALLATGCAADDDGAAEAPADQDTAQVEVPEADGEADGEEADPEADEGDSEISVETVGDSPHAFITEQAPDGPAVEVAGELIIGPGGYMAVAQEGQPQVLVFDEEAEFSFRDGAPSVTTSALGTLEVGESVELTGVEHPIDAIDGLPLERLGGADEQALFVSDE